MSFSHRNARALASLALLISGCATAPETAERPQEIVPEPQWTSVATDSDQQAVAQVAWLQTFGDDTLVSLVDQALAHNFDLRAVAQSLEAARATTRIAGADRYPQIGAGLNASRRQVLIETADGADALRSDQHDLGLNLSWEIDLWGRLRDQTSASVADFQAAEADLAAARLSLSGQIAKAWFRASSARLLLNLASDTVSSFDATADLVRDRFETGVSTSLELRLALANAAAAHALIQLRTQELDQASRSLEVLMGRYPANHLATVDTLPEIPLTVPAGLPSELLERRPDIIAAERRLAAADTRVRVARKSLLPSIALTGSGGTSSTDLENLLDADFEVWSIAAGLVQPIFQGGRLRANVDVNKAVAEQANAVYLSTVLRAFEEVETTLAAEETLRQREISLAEAAEHSAGAERLARDEYEAGLADIFSVLESQRRALDARSSHIQVREQRLRNRIDLFLALGGDFEMTGQTASASLAKQSPHIAQNR